MIEFPFDELVILKFGVPLVAPTLPLPLPRPTTPRLPGTPLKDAPLLAPLEFHAPLGLNVPLAGPLPLEIDPLIWGPPPRFGIPPPLVWLPLRTFPSLPLPLGGDG